MVKNLLIVGLIVIGIGAGFAGGLYFQKLQVTKPQVTKTVTPSPTPDTSKFENLKATVKSFDGKKLVYTLENGKDATLADIAGVDVWVSAKKPGDKASKGDWKAVKTGDKLMLASDKETGKIVAALVL